MKDMGGNCNALTGKEVKDLAGVRKLWLWSVPLLVEGWREGTKNQGSWETIIRSDVNPVIRSGGMSPLFGLSRLSKLNKNILVFLKTDYLKVNILKLRSFKI